MSNVQEQEKEPARQPVGFYMLQPEQFKAVVHAALDAYRHTVTKVKTNPVSSWTHSIQPLEEAAEKLGRVWGLLEHENAVCNTPEIRAIYEGLLTVVTNLHTDLLQDTELCNIYHAIHDGPEFKQLSTPQQAIIEHALRDFKLAGVDLPPEARAQYKTLYERLTALENDFSNNVLDATEGWTYHVTTADKHLLEGVPEHVIEQAKQNAIADQKSGWVLNLDHPTFYAIIEHAQNRQLREEMYVAYYTRASNQGPMAGKWDNTPIMQEILDIRQQLAQLIGYANYAEYSLVPKMARNTQEVRDFLQQMIDRVKPQAQREYTKLTDFAKQQGFTQHLTAWDIAYYAEMYRKLHYDISDESLRQYFPESRVLEGMFKLCQTLFGLHIEEVDDFPTWDAAVRMFKVSDHQHHLRGHFYIDLYTREGKRGGAWMEECVARIRFANNVLQTPVAYLNCNFAKPIDDKPGRLTHHDVLTLFHEFGHTLHHVLTQVDYLSVSGMNGVSWDAVELPSQFMENWAWEWQVMQNISADVDGAPMPRAVFDKLLESRDYNSGMFLLRQLEFSLFDFRLHENLAVDKGHSVHEVLQVVRKEVAVLQPPAVNRFENSFSHIFAGGYAAGYYSYLWAEVLSCDAFAKFRIDGLFNAHTGQAFVTKILEKGGSEPAMDLFVEFAGREPSVDALLERHAIV